MKLVAKTLNEMITNNLINVEPKFEEMDKMIIDDNFIKKTHRPIPTSPVNLTSPLKTKKNTNPSITTLTAEPLDDNMSTILDK